MAGTENESDSNSTGNEVEPISDWPYKSRYQQSPVDHFSVDRLPSRSRRKAMLLSFFLGLWGVQRMYLRRPALGWFCFVWTKVGVLGGILLVLFGLVPAGLVLLIGFPLISWLIGIGDLVALAAGLIRTDGLGKPLDP